MLSSILNNIRIKMTQIGYHLNKELISALTKDNVLPMDYKPAYGGESIGLDLYNASDTSFVIPPATRELEDPSTLLSKKDLRFRTLIPTGLHLALPRNTVALIQERGSITKTTFKVRAGVIDPGYTDQIFVNLVNLSNEEFAIEPFQKLPVQIVVLPAYTNFKFLPINEYKEYITSATRQEGKIGSSDKE